MTLTKLFYAAVAGLGMASAQATDLAASFDHHALGQRLDASCTVQEMQRRAAIIPVTSGLDPAPEYRTKGLTFVMQSAHFDAKMHARADKIYATIPHHTKALTYNDGGVFVWSRYGLAESLPSRKHAANGYTTPGLYLEYERRLYFPFMLADVRKNKNGTYRPLGFYEEPTRGVRIANHETGHMVDDILGNYSFENGAARADGRLTDRRDYRAAIAEDLRHIRGTKPDVVALDYYMPIRIGGKQDEGQRLRREVFAELWAEASGQGGSNLSRHYPRTYAIVKSYFDYLKAVTVAGGVSCDYRKDGRAVPVLKR